MTPENYKGIAVLFPDFETLDVFGPVEVLGHHYDLTYASLEGGLISSNHGAEISTKPISSVEDRFAFVLVPGGMGTRVEVSNSELIAGIRQFAEESDYVMTVCTGAALLAKTGLLDGRRATSNKAAYEWVSNQGPNVAWQRDARWVRDTRFYTSSGISAGIDMSLGFIRDRFGLEQTQQTWTRMEYVWNSDPSNDPFALPSGSA